MQTCCRRSTFRRIGFLTPVVCILLVGGWSNAECESPGDERQSAPSQQPPSDENYLGPTALAAAADGSTLYVACADAGEVLWVGLPKGEVTRRVSVPGEPTCVLLAPDGKRLFVTCAAPKSVVAVLDAETGTVLATHEAGHTAADAVLDPSTDRLFVCNRFDNDVSVIHLATGRELCRVPAVSRAGRGSHLRRRPNRRRRQPPAQHADQRHGHGGRPPDGHAH